MEAEPLITACCHGGRKMERIDLSFGVSVRVCVFTSANECVCACRCLIHAWVCLYVCVHACVADPLPSSSLESLCMYTGGAVALPPVAEVLLVKMPLINFSILRSLLGPRCPCC